MQPLLEDKVDYFKRRVGLGKSSTARLFSDRVEVVDKAGAPIVTLTLKDITQVNYVKGGQIQLYVGDQLHILAFFRMPYRLFGLLGLWLSKSMTRGKAWETQLTQLGFKVETKLI